MKQNKEAAEKNNTKLKNQKDIISQLEKKVAD